MEAQLPLTVDVDGIRATATVRPRLLLSDFLRNTAGATSVHLGCGQGLCGACTIALDGVPVRACLMLAIQADGAQIQTVASLAALEKHSEAGLTTLQRAFQQHHALQCGFCTPGLLVATAMFLTENATPDRGQILEHLDGHLCRCTGYANIIAAIEAVVAERRPR